MNILSLVSVLLSIVAFTYSLITGRKIHKFDLLIKEHEVKKNEWEEEEKKKASIECNVVESPGNELNVLRFYNKGRNDATNISFDIIDDPEDAISFMMPQNYLPYPKLRPQQPFEIRYYAIDKKPHYTMRITWDDEFGANRSIEQVIDL
jgi:hypothetical protein